MVDQYIDKVVHLLLLDSEVLMTLSNGAFLWKQLKGLLAAVNYFCKRVSSGVCLGPKFTARVNCKFIKCITVTDAYVYRSIWDYMRVLPPILDHWSMLEWNKEHNFQWKTGSLKVSFSVSTHTFPKIFLHPTLLFINFLKIFSRVLEGGFSWNYFHFFFFAGSFNNKRTYVRVSGF